MKISTKGQVTIPKEIRDELGLLPDTEVEFEVRGGEVVLRRSSRDPMRRGNALVEHLRSRGAAFRLSTDELLGLTRGDE